MSKKYEKKLALLENLQATFGGTVVTRKQLVEFIEANGVDFPHWIANDKAIRLGRGEYDIGSLIARFGGVATTTETTVESETTTETVEETASASL